MPYSSCYCTQCFIESGRETEVFPSVLGGNQMLSSPALENLVIARGAGSVFDLSNLMVCDRLRVRLDVKLEGGGRPPTIQLRYYTVRHRSSTSSCLCLSCIDEGTSAKVPATYERQSFLTGFPVNFRRLWPFHFREGTLGFRRCASRRPSALSELWR